MRKFLGVLILFISLVSIWYASGDTETVITFAERMKFFLILVPAAIWDSINPCAFAVMFILLSAILKKKWSKNEVLLAWFLFILAIFISYMAMWLWLYTALATSTNTFYLKLIVWIIWIIVWLANLKDFFWYWKWFKFEVPDSWRPKMAKIINSITSPWGAFFIGFIISLFLLPCTSGPYIIVLWYLASESSSINWWWYLYILIYNLLFIIPMIIISIMIAFGHRSVWELREYKELNAEKLHLITWIVMLILWIYILNDILL